MDWLTGLVTFPLRLTTGIVQFLLLFLRTLIPGMRVNTPTRPLGETLQQRYGTTFPAFRTGSFQEACNEAKRGFKFLFVYVHSEDHVDTDRFCRDVLSAEPLVSFLNDNFICYAASVSTAEGQAVAQQLRVASFPFVSLLVSQETGKMMVGYREEGVVPVDTLIESLTDCMDRFEPLLVAMRADHVVRSQTQTLREEQDAAYQQSLREDQEKEARKQEEERQRKLQEEEAARKEREAQEEAERRVKEREEKKRRIPAEPAESDACARIVVQMPGGKRLTRRFPLTSTLQDLYDYVDCEAIVNNFTLFTNYPKRALEDRAMTLEAAGLARSMILCQDNDA